MNTLSVSITIKTLSMCGRSRNCKSNNTLKVKNNCSCKKEEATFNCYIVIEPQYFTASFSWLYRFFLSQLLLLLVNCKLKLNKKTVIPQNTVKFFSFLPQWDSTCRVKPVKRNVFPYLGPQGVSLHAHNNQLIV